MKRFIFTAIAFFWYGCAPDFSGANIHYKTSSTSTSVFTSFSLKVNEQEISPSPQMLLAYSNVLAKAKLTENCQVNAFIREHIKTNDQSLWYLGAVLMIPFWPAMPVKTSLRLQSVIEIYCGGHLVERLDFVEEDSFKLFWFGPYRTGKAKEQLDWLHEKIIVQLQFSLEHQAPVDAGCASDF
ncbi:MAG TPA: hypothetical protein GX724_03195 [Fibrobacter sp.]|nr:hypothetical protein [Fibrobacter sp.]